MGWDAENERCTSFKIREMRMLAETSTALSQFTAEANQANGLELLASGKLFTIGEQQLPVLEDTLAKHERECKASLAPLRLELGAQQAEQRQMEVIVNMTECAPTTALIQCPSQRNGEHPFSFVTFGERSLRKAIAQLKFADAASLAGSAPGGLRNCRRYGGTKPGY